MEEKIRQALDEHGGGMKFMELLAAVMQIHSYTNPNTLQECIEKMPDVKILTYTWHRMNREKMFVYTP